MTRYYYVGVFLPALSLDQKPEIDLVEFQETLDQNLTQADLEKAKQLYRLFDILNLRSLWLEKPIDLKGGLNRHELEEAVVNQTGLPDYVYEFLEKYSTLTDRLHHFPWLLVRFFRQMDERTNAFVRDYLNFEREWRLVFIGFRSKKLGRDLSVELQYENPEEELIAQLLAQKDAKEFEPPEKYAGLKTLFETYGDDPLRLEKAIDQYRFDSIGHLVADRDQFSINPILAYMAQLMIVEKWFAIDKSKGLKIVDTIVKGTS